MGIYLACTPSRVLESGILGHLVPEGWLGGALWEVSLASTHCRHLGACSEVLCDSLLGHSNGPMQVMAGQWLPAQVWGGVQGQSGY